jgi:endonuclease-8
LSDEFDLVAVCESIRRLDPRCEIGIALLDQSVLAGIGNIYRCESLFAFRVSPFRRLGEIDDVLLADLVLFCRQHMIQSVRTQAGRSFETPTLRPAVHGRGGQRCLRCGGMIEARRFKSEFGGPVRWIYRCPQCQLH